MNGLRAVLVALVIALGGPASAGAHAVLERAEPRVGSKVKAPPAEVKLYFTQRLEPAYSAVRVTTPTGERVDRNDSHVDPARPDVLRVSLSPLSPGAYKVVWRVLSVDTHVTEGDFTFHVAP